MRTFPVCLASLALLVVGILVGCSQTPPKSPDVSDAIRKSLDQAGFKDVSVAQDREKGVVTLAGHVAAEGDKSQAESIAKSIAGGQVGACVARLERRFHACHTLGRFLAADAIAYSAGGLARYLTADVGVKSGAVALGDGIGGVCLDCDHYRLH